jgi:hypothetical protein
LVFSSTAFAPRLASNIATLRIAAGLLVMGPLGCIPAAREEPTLEEKCEALETFCVDLPESREDLRTCHDTGARGLDEPSHQDRCFVAYDECFDDCYYLYEQRRAQDELDAG